MAYRGIQEESRRRVPRLYLVTPHDPSEGSHQLLEALRAADIAAILLQVPPGDEGAQLSHVKAVAPPVQDQGAALLLHGYPELAARIGADGAHLDGVANLKASLSLLKPAHIAGCGRLASRHDAMLAGEAGADYVMFGEPGPMGERPPFDAIAKRVRWWAELFEIPCVAYAGSLDEVEALAGAGADFIAVGDLVFADRRGCSMAVADVAQRLQAGQILA